MKASYVKRSLLETLSYMETERFSYVKRPRADFTRRRKCSFQNLLRCLLTMENHSLNRELRRFFPSSDTVLTSSAFCQQRAKLNEQALPAFLSLINEKMPFGKCFKGFHLVAVDGSDINIPPAENSPDTYVPSNTEGVGYHQMHLNALYDLREERYTDILVQPRASIDERAAFLDLLQAYSVPGRTIFIADRGYFSLNVLAHLLSSGHYFLLRTTTADSPSSFFKRFSLLDTARFDVPLEFDITRSQKRCYRDHPDRIVPIRPDRTFDFIPLADRKSLFHVSVRFVKVQLPGGPEYLLTNLPADSFGLPLLKKLYSMRWGIETSFRFLKYTFSLTSFHSIRRDFIRQEIYARVIMYNLTRLLIHTVVLPKSLRDKYKVSVSEAAFTCRCFLLGQISLSRAITSLAHYLTRIRPGRAYPRKVRNQRNKPLNNRT